LAAADYLMILYKEGKRMPRKKIEKAQEVTQEAGETLVVEGPPAHPNMVPPTLMFPESRPALVDGNPTVRRIAQILQNGTTSANHPHVNFAAYSNFFIKLRNAYEARDEDAFFTILSEYLTAAQGHIRHAMASQDEIDISLAEVRRLVAQLQSSGSKKAFEHVAGYLILVGRSPFDHL
jgi:hypothetical protein